MAGEIIYELGARFFLEDNTSATLKKIREAAQATWASVEKIRAAFSGLGASTASADNVVRMSRAAANAAGMTAKATADTLRFQTLREESVARTVAMEKAGAAAQVAAADKIAAAGRQFGGGGGMRNLMLALGAGAAGQAGFSALRGGMTGAMGLQMSLVNIQAATGASKAQIEQIRSAAYDISNMTAQSVVDSANIMKIMATSGLTIAQVLQIARPAAMFADVQYVSRKVPFEEGATEAIQLAHLFGKYNPSDLHDIFNKLTAASTMMPDSLKFALTQGRQFIPGLEALRVPDGQIVATSVMLDRGGLGKGRGGTSVAALAMQALGPLQMTQHLQAGKAALERQVGLLDAHGRSTFFHYDPRHPNDPKKTYYDWVGLLRQLGTYAAGHRPDDVLRIYHSIFGSTGDKLAAITTKTGFVKMLNEIVAKIDNAPDMTKRQGQFMNTAWGQMQRFTTNLSTLWVDVMWPWLDDARRAFSDLANITHDAQAWLHKNRDAAKGLGAVVGLGSAAGMLLAAKQLYGFVSGMGQIGTLARGATAAEAGAGLFAALRPAINAAAVALIGPEGLAIGAALAAGVLVMKFTPVGPTIDRWLRDQARLHNGFGSLADGLDRILHFLHLVPDIPQMHSTNMKAVDAHIRKVHAAMGPVQHTQPWYQKALGVLDLKDAGSNLLHAFTGSGNDVMRQREMQRLHNIAHAGDRQGLRDVVHAHESLHASQRTRDVAQAHPVVINANNWEVKVPPGTTKEQARALFEEFMRQLTRGYQSAARTQGSVGSLWSVPSLQGMPNAASGGQQ